MSVKHTWVVTFQAWPQQRGKVGCQTKESLTTMYFDSENVGKRLVQELFERGENWMNDVARKYPNDGYENTQPHIMMLQDLGETDG